MPVVMENRVAEIVETIRATYFLEVKARQLKALYTQPEPESTSLLQRGITFARERMWGPSSRDEEPAYVPHEVAADGDPDPLFNFTPLPGRARESYAYKPVSGRILYLLNNSRPYHNGGYAVRAHGIIKALQRQGIDVIPVLRPGYPADNFKSVRADNVVDVDGVSYRFLSQDANRYEMRRDQYAKIYEAELLKLVRKLRPAVLHAASFHFNAHAALKVREKLGTPVIYEVRGLSLLVDMSIGRGTDKSRPKMLPSWSRLLEFHEEVEVAKAADHLLCITSAMSQLFQSLGVPAERCSLLLNAAEETEHEIRSGQRISKGTVGYFGSIQFYEGLEDLCTAIEILAEEHPELNANALVIGDGPHTRTLKSRIASSPHRHLIKFHGRISHERIRSYFGQCQAMIYPRRPFPVSELVSPLKPFEPMALGIPVISSDVAALSEIVLDGRTGFTFRAGDPRELAKTIASVLRNSAEATSVSENARRYVQDERTWRRTTEALPELYRKLETQAHSKRRWFAL